MHIDIQYFYKGCIIVAAFLGILSCSKKQDIPFPKKVKVSLREVGHHLLLANQDSTTIVKPVVTLAELKYQLSFEEQLEIHPDSLVIYMDNSFKKAMLPRDYFIEVLQCIDKEVAYSYYENGRKTGNTDIHCRKRQLKKGCYRIHVTFMEIPETGTRQFGSAHVLLSGIAIVLAIAFIYFKINPKSIPKHSNKDFAPIGKYKFYPEQNKLIKEASEISLSKKECELLSIFIANPFQIMKREELTKKVWEDKGVIVGRSLDTYISKLRKKLREDPSVKLTNIHGVGYRLEF
ncbi:MAG: winged helix-turn-helix domain-containing protein [Bacteroidota bacterium]